MAPIRPFHFVVFRKDGKHVRSLLNYPSQKDAEAIGASLITRLLDGFVVGRPDLDEFQKQSELDMAVLDMTTEVSRRSFMRREMTQC